MSSSAKKNQSLITRFTLDSVEWRVHVPPEEVEIVDLLQSGWFRSADNPEFVVKAFPTLRIKEEYKLRAYQFIEGGNGNGMVWAIPSHSELPRVEDCELLKKYFLTPPRPLNAFEDKMMAIDGNRSPLSYLQAAIAYHELNEFGAMWHGVSWGQDEMIYVESLPLGNEFGEAEDALDIVEPHFFYNDTGHPTVVFHTINNIITKKLLRYTHVFSMDDYTMTATVNQLAEGGYGIIF